MGEVIRVFPEPLHAGECALQTGAMTSFMIVSFGQSE